MFAKEFLAPFLTRFGEHDRLGLAHRIEDHSLLMQTIHCIPVVSFPGTSAVMNGQEEKREHHLVNLVFVIFHAIILPWRSPGFNRGCKGKTPKIATGNAGWCLPLPFAGASSAPCARASPLR